MKNTIKNTLLLNIIISIFFACGDVKDLNIVGKWKIENIKGVEGKKNDDLGLALITLLGSEYKENIISFSNDSSFLTLNKNGEVFQKGTFQLKNNKLILSFNNGTIEKYEIIGDKKSFELKSDNIIMTFTSKNK